MYVLVYIYIYTQVCSLGCAKPAAISANVSPRTLAHSLGQPKMAACHAAESTAAVCDLCDGWLTIWPLSRNVAWPDNRGKPPGLVHRQPTHGCQASDS